MTYHDHGQPIITNPDKSVKNEDNDIKLSNVVTLDHLRDIPLSGQPNLT